MRRAFTAAQVREAERPLLEQGLGEELMARAAYGLAQVALRELRTHAGLVYGTHAIVLAGPGNNGGDARIAGAHLAAAGVGVEIVDALAPLDDAGVLALGERLAAADLVVDGVFGTGARPGLPAQLEAVIDVWRHRLGESASRGHRTSTRTAGSQRVIAVDIPSGVDGTSGQADGDGRPGAHIAADVTVTFAAEKSGLLLAPGCAAAGRVEVVDIGIEIPFEPDALSVEHGDLAGIWPMPRPDAHKYTRGVLGLLAGSAEYPGAAILSATAALSAGVGMIRALLPEPALGALIQACPEAVPVEGRVQAWAMGPGAPDPDRMRAILSRLRAGRPDSGTEDDAGSDSAPVPPAVLDAGALELVEGPLGVPAVLTPHAGELAGLLGRLGVEVARAEIEAEPAAFARRAAELTGAVVLLKGPVTTVAAPHGPLYAQAAGTPWLATAGSGDVLTGLIGAGLAGAFPDGATVDDLPRLAELAAAAAELHGRAAGTGPVRALILARNLTGVIGGLV